ncbi:HET-domain-containing protein, partial [Parathielavia hyrcaniae]
YATLSHRWGTANIFQLKLGNLEALQKEIPVDELSKTFQDAFVAAKKLGVRHIWIDSLCIIQDSLGDWQREAALMQHVYSDARFNISATGAEDGDDGLFFDRRRFEVVPFTIEITSTAPREEHYIGPGSYRFINPRLWSHSISQAPLNGRGWVMQERLLARRIVRFCTNQIFFECRESEVCEMFPSDIPDTGAFALSHSLESRLCLPAWFQLVETYAPLALTKPEDKLPAFSGIAKLMQQRPGMSGDVYLAGPWRRHLLYHLLWRRSRP